MSKYQGRTDKIGRLFKHTESEILFLVISQGSYGDALYDLSAKAIVIFEPMELFCRCCDGTYEEVAL